VHYTKKCSRRRRHEAKAASFPRLGRACERPVYYSFSMTKILEEAIQKIQKLPEFDQDEVAAMLLSVASRNAETMELVELMRAAIREGRKQARERTFVGDKDISSGVMGEAL
jgi:hypothetical protein